LYAAVAAGATDDDDVDVSTAVAYTKQKKPPANAVTQYDWDNFKVKFAF